MTFDDRPMPRSHDEGKGDDIPEQIWPEQVWLEQIWIVFFLTAR